MTVAPGTLTAGKYRVERVIGEGGMGIVVAARHIELGRRVAVKLVRRDAIAAGSIDRLLREARAAASIENPHVARVLDVGRTSTGEPFLVLEHLHGEDLHARLGRGVVSVSDAVRWILEACDGLAAAHACGLVHRDLKPGNLFLAKQADGRETIKLLDFGLAKSVKSDDGRITATGAILGSPSYMSPEHLSDRPLDARSDVWSLGVTLFELLANTLPFSGRTTPEICAAVLSSPPSSLAQHRPDVPAALEAVVMACLEKDPAQRPTDVAELASRLEPLADGVNCRVRVARLRDIGSDDDVKGVFADSVVVATIGLALDSLGDAPPCAMTSTTTPIARASSNACCEGPVESATVAGAVVALLGAAGVVTGIADGDHVVVATAPVRHGLFDRDEEHGRALASEGSRRRTRTL